MSTGTMTRWGMTTSLFAAVAAVAAGPVVAQTANGVQLPAASDSFKKANAVFRRVASFPVFLNTDVDAETVSEIVAASKDGMTLIYTDGATESIGFVDITDPSDPQPGGVVAVGGEPTSVAVRGKYALACVNTSADFVNTSGDLEVIDIASRQIVHTIPLGGQPDAIAVSPNERYACIAIENERDENLGSGEPPQAPPGFVVIVDTKSNGPATWTTRTVDLVGIPTLFPTDPEPEFVDVSALNVAAVTLQENNHVVLIHLPTGLVIHDFEAGVANLTGVDVDENDLIEQEASIAGVPREPDAIAWTSLFTLATADEGDLFGGSRGFTTWDILGNTLFEANAEVEHAAARVGHYPEDRSENKGTEPETVELGRYGKRRFLFVGSERANLVLVYELFVPCLFASVFPLLRPVLGSVFPLLRQVLPTGSSPEGLLAIPERNLFVVASENDSREDRIRATVMIYEFGAAANYPDVESDDRAGTGVPIPWGALSGLTVDPANDATVYAVHDSFYRASRIFTLDHAQTPARITGETVVRDTRGLLLAALSGLKAQLPGTDDFGPTDLVEADGHVNLDAEGLALTSDETTFWIASEGAGNLKGGVSDPDDRPFESPNLLARVSVDPSDPSTAHVTDVVLPPLGLTRNQFRFGFEGVAVIEDAGGPSAVFVVFQRAWTDAGDPSGMARIGRYDLATGAWTFAYYPLETPTSPFGGWVGLSELTWLGGDDFAVIERDNQGGPDETIKHLTRFSIAGVAFQDDAQAGTFDVVAKTLVADLVASGAYDAGGGLLPEKLEGLTVLSDGTALVVNDNDGVEDNNGETRLLRLDRLFQ